MTRKDAKKLRIGVVVLYIATVEVCYVNEYDDSSTDTVDEFASWNFDAKPSRTVRKAVRTELSEPRLAIIVGAVNRQLGEYCPQYTSGMPGEEEPVQASLSVSGTVTILQLRSRLFGRVIEALAEDCEVFDG